MQPDARSPARANPLRTLHASINTTLRYKLLVLVLAPIFLIVPISLGLAIYWSKAFSYEQLLLKVNTDLSVARDAFQRSQENYLGKLERLAESHTFRNRFDAGDADGIQALLQVLRVTEGFDFVHLEDRSGTWLYEASASGVGSSKLSPLADKAMGGTPAAGVEVFSYDNLERESPDLAERIYMDLIDTAHAGPTTRAVEDRGLVMRMMYPVRDRAGQVVAVLDGGVVLNRNFAIVDRIRDLVYGPGSLPPDGVGTVTLFLDDVRISTNVMIRADQRALGTRVSQAVRDKVLGQGASWADRAFVVHDWYISAYEPIYDNHGLRVGMLYTGFLEAPFRQASQRAQAALLAAFLLVVLLSAAFAIRGAKSIFRPIEAMTQVVRATQAGLDRRIGQVASQDEIGELARQLDAMLELLASRNRQIQRAAEELEVKVEERTRELRDKNRALERTVALLRQTRKQLVMAEKLAALGQLTAGIAHEINNPTAVILGNLDVLVAELGAGAQPVRVEIDLIIQQVYRIRAIVNNLLQYARPSEFESQLQEVDVNAVIEDSLMLVTHLVDQERVTVVKNFKAARRIKINPQELQQVLVNLLTNALHAMHAGGRLRVSTEDWEERGVVARIKDDGVGITPEHLQRVFDPFFTTKRQGTGLGLSVSYGMIRRYGGDITVRSKVEKGSTFYLWLLKEPRLEAGDPAAGGAVSNR